MREGDRFLPKPQQELGWEVINFLLGNIQDNQRSL
jgi:hypothetical protein